MRPEPMDGSWGLPALNLPGIMLRRFNAERARCEAAPLVFREPLQRAAQAWASELARRKALALTAAGTGGLFGYARQAGHNGDLQGFVLQAPSAEQGLRRLLEAPLFVEVLQNPLCRGLGLGLREGRMALLLEAPYFLEADELLARIQTLLNHARALRGAPPLSLDDGLSALARRRCDASLGGGDEALGQVVVDYGGSGVVIQATPSSLGRAVRELLADPVLGPLLYDPATARLGLAARRGTDRFCLLCGAS